MCCGLWRGPRLTCAVCRWQATLLLHLLLWLRDKLPLPCILAGAAAQIAYWRLLRTFPFFRIVSVDTATAAGTLLPESPLAASV